MVVIAVKALQSRL